MPIEIKAGQEEPVVLDGVARKVTDIEENGTFTNHIDGYEMKSFIVHTRVDFPKQELRGKALPT
jgi:hypothetical protein